MTVVGREKLVKFMEGHAQARPALKAWLAEARDASWRRPVDIKKRYPSADILPDTHAEYSKRSFGG